ncbi:uncharacterized protein BDR25DRAFT_241792 [Lindgomyces ingoldianus]|uniref:Uncharacterized protein n=1 Tax=Lindgomyces ingoldianus TaxID=673940 RepID=A0ACB6QDT0_9PLEO|nr:uncharacterized protein BDR25DRAFT_241792 [Lindgomyces ingoldianus]KAF2464768.1 hypothetical protein BDR25DRAFT_241792 [Lindgomyces ingoldianus]
MSSSAGPSGVEKRGSGATVRACDSCRRRKRRCIWSSGEEGCTPCLQAKEECSTTHIRKPRAKSQKRNRIAEYESRIQRLESLLEERSAAQPSAPEPPLQDQSQPLSNWVDNLRNEINSWPLIDRPSISKTFETGLEEIEDELAPGGPTELSLEQASSEEFPLSMSNPSESEPVISYEISQEQPCQGSVFGSKTPESTMIGSQPDMPPFLSRSRCDGYLPSPELGTSLLTEFLVDFNTACALFRPWVIAEHMRRSYTGGSDGTALAWANTYIVLGIAHRLRAMSAAAAPEDNEMADFYLSRVLGSVSDLLLAEPSLALIQCLLGLAKLIQTSSHSAPHALFISTALRMAQCLSYNDDDSQPLGPDQDIEQQRRVFWIAFSMDTDTSILSNAPTTHRRDDVGASQPEDNPQDDGGAVKAADGDWKVNIFSLRIALALLQAEAVEQVLSLKARRTKPQDVVATAQTLLEKLQAWHGHELFQFEAEQLMQLLYRSDIVHTVSLEASYFATVFRLQTFLALGMDARVNPFSTEALTKIIGMKEQPCFRDAKRFLSLLSVAPQGDIGLGWTTKPQIIAALCTVLAHALESPSEYTPSLAEMQNISGLIKMLESMAQKSQDGELKTAQGLCALLFSKLKAGQRARGIGIAGGAEIIPFPVTEAAY